MALLRAPYAPVMLPRALLNHHLPLLVGALFVYVSIATGYTFQLNPEFLKSVDYFSIQAKAWMQGRLDLPLPEPGFDMSPYKGRIYLYWGPSNTLLPFLCLAVFRNDFGMTLRTIIYLILGIFFFTRAATAIRSHYHPAAPRWLLGVFASTLAFGTAVPTLIYRGGSVYHESIALSFALQMLTVWVWLRLGATSTLPLAGGFGLVTALAVAARITNVLALPALYIYALLHRSAVGISRLLLSLAAFGILMCGLLWYNHARFNTPFRTGADYATGVPKYMAILQKNDAMLSPVWLRRNFHIYFLKIPQRKNFVARLAHAWPSTFGKEVAHLQPPDERVYVDAHSVLVMTPLLAFITLFAFTRLNPRQRLLAFALGAAFILHLAFLLCYAWTMRRFTVDFVPLGLLLGYMASAAFLERFPQAATRLRDAGLVLLAWSATMHFFILRAGAAKTRNQHLLTEGMHMASPVWPAALIAVILVACLIETRAEPQPTTHSA